MMLKLSCPATDQLRVEVSVASGTGQTWLRTLPARGAVDAPYLTTELQEAAYRSARALGYHVRRQAEAKLAIGRTNQDMQPLHIVDGTTMAVIGEVDQATLREILRAAYTLAGRIWPVARSLGQLEQVYAEVDPAMRQVVRQALGSIVNN